MPRTRRTARMAKVPPPPPAPEAESKNDAEEVLCLEFAGHEPAPEDKGTPATTDMSLSPEKQDQDRSLELEDPMSVSPKKEIKDNRGRDDDDDEEREEGDGGEDELLHVKPPAKKVKRKVFEEDSDEECFKTQEDKPVVETVRDDSDSSGSELEDKEAEEDEEEDVLGIVDDKAEESDGSDDSKEEIWEDELQEKLVTTAVQAAAYMKPYAPTGRGEDSDPSSDEDYEEPPKLEGNDGNSAQSDAEDSDDDEDYVLFLKEKKAKSKKKEEDSPVDFSKFVGASPEAPKTEKGGKVSNMFAPGYPVVACLPNRQVDTNGFMTLWMVWQNGCSKSSGRPRPGYANFLLKLNAENMNLNLLTQLGAGPDAVFDVTDKRGDEITIPDPRGKTGPRKVHAVATFSHVEIPVKQLWHIIKDFKQTIDTLEFQGGDGLDKQCQFLTPTPFLDSANYLGNWIGMEGLTRAIRRFSTEFQPYTKWGGNKREVLAQYYEVGNWGFKEGQYFGCPFSWLSPSGKTAAKVYRKMNRGKLEAETKESGTRVKSEKKSHKKIKSEKRRSRK